MSSIPSPSTFADKLPHNEKLKFRRISKDFEAFAEGLIEEREKAIRKDANSDVEYQAKLTDAYWRESVALDDLVLEILKCGALPEPLREGYQAKLEAAREIHNRFRPPSRDL